MYHSKPDCTKPQSSPNFASFHSHKRDLVTDFCLRKSIPSNIIHNPPPPPNKTPMNAEQAWRHSTKYDFGILKAVSEISYICEP